MQLLLLGAVTASSGALVACGHPDQDREAYAVTVTVTSLTKGTGVAGVTVSFVASVVPAQACLTGGDGKCTVTLGGLPNSWDVTATKNGVSVTAVHPGGKTSLQIMTNAFD